MPSDAGKHAWTKWEVGVCVDGVAEGHRSTVRCGVSLSNQWKEKRERTDRQPALTSLINRRLSPTRPPRLGGRAGLHSDQVRSNSIDITTRWNSMLSKCDEERR